MRLVTEHRSEEILTIRRPNGLTLEQYDWLQQREDFVGGGRYQYQLRVPAHDVTYAPTLADVHRWLWDDWGPVYLNWEEGMLCPFHPDVGRNNMKCLEGNCISRVFLVVDDRDVEFVPQYAHTIGRVTCHQWFHILTEAIRDIPIEVQQELPDDFSLAASILLTYVYEVTGYFEWRAELENRQKKSKRHWLQPLEEQWHSIDRKDD